MKYALTALILTGIVFCVMTSGCTSPTGALMKTVAATPATMTTTSTDAITLSSATLAPVQTLPAEQYVDVQLSKERPDYTIHLLYNGGKGEVSVQNVFLRVTLPDGQVIEKYMNDNQRQPRRGDEIVVKGTRGSDRAEVYITSVGQTYKVLDKDLVANRM